MTEGLPNEYVGTFPVACGVSIPFYFSVETSTFCTITSPAGAPANTYTAPSGYLLTFFDDDFQTDTGWTVSNNQFPTSGIWERADPTLDAFCDRGNPPTDADGSGLCYVTESDPLDCDSDVDSGSTTLTSQNLDASHPNSTVSYSRWWAAPSNLNLVVEVSDDGGSNWTFLETPGGSSGGWVDKSFRISDFVTNTNQFRIRFRAGDPTLGVIVEGGVDAVKVEAIHCPSPCPWDCQDTPNLFVDIGDLFELFGHWFAPGPCDFDNNGLADINDLFAMFGNWGICP